MDCDIPDTPFTYLEVNEGLRLYSNYEKRFAEAVESSRRRSKKAEFEKQEKTAMGKREFTNLTNLPVTFITSAALKWLVFE